MKKVILILSATLLVACNSSKDKKNSLENSAIEMATENSNKKINDTVPYEDTVMLLGESNRQGLLMEPFKEWYNLGYSHYRTAPEVAIELKPLLEDVSISVFMGTWCEDSQRDVPHLYKILDDTGFDESNLTLVNVNDEKTTPQGLEDGKDIINVPTIIFYKDGVELGRIVEYPIETVEKDMLKILSGKNYKHAYAE